MTKEKQSVRSDTLVIRGGSWNDAAANCRSAFRAPEDVHDDLRFRVVCQDVDNPRADLYYENDNHSHNSSFFLSLPN